jgi:transcriptional regulator
MYLPESFHETRDDALHGLLRACPLGAIVTHGADGLDANHVPLELVNGAHLHGHIARGNPLARLDGAPVLVIFRGADAYISPNWYPSKQATHREVPTWNYAVAHVHGRLRVVDDRVWLRDLLERLTDRHEAAEAQPWRIGDAPEEHIQTLLRAIIGIDIAIERIEGKFKLSQNHPAANRAGVMQGLRERAAARDVELASLMRYST